MLQANLQTIRFHTHPIAGEATTHIGARAFQAFHAALLNKISYSISDRKQDDQYLDEYDRPDPLIGWSEIVKSHHNELAAKRATMINAYMLVYNEHQADLGRYFRLLFNVLHFLSEKRTVLPNSMYETYFKIVRDALSNYELILIMANCLTDKGAHMKRYVAEFELFDNLPHNLLSAEVLDESYNHTRDVNFSSLWVDFEERSFGENIGNFSD